MISEVGEVSSLACGTDAISCPSEEHRDLRNVVWSSTVLEHLWNKTAVHGWGRLVSLRPFRRFVA
jgi:hypothetical protein